MEDKNVQINEAEPKEAAVIMEEDENMSKSDN
jgi:hypothetical protein